MVDYDKAQRIAERLAKGETVDNKEMRDTYDLVEIRVREIRNNCNLVLRQLKEIAK